ncbi:hypothetical protein ACUHMQ_05470 [Chitinimonas sp. PSY-7]
MQEINKKEAEQVAGGGLGAFAAIFGLIAFYITGSIVKNQGR